MCDASCLTVAMRMGQGCSVTTPPAANRPAMRAPVRRLARSHGVQQATNGLVWSVTSRPCMSAPRSLINTGLMGLFRLAHCGSGGRKAGPRAGVLLLPCGLAAAAIAPCTLPGHCPGCCWRHSGGWSPPWDAATQLAGGLWAPLACLSQSDCTAQPPDCSLAAPRPAIFCSGSRGAGGPPGGCSARPGRASRSL